MTATLLDHWKAFQEMAIPKGVGRGQIDAMRNSFYGGAAMVMCTLEAIEKPEISEEEGVRILGDMAQEIHDYMAKHKMKHGL